LVVLLPLLPMLLATTIMRSHMLSAAYMEKPL